jgi:hypothetical protein
MHPDGSECKDCCDVMMWEYNDGFQVLADFKTLDLDNLISLNMWVRDPNSKSSITMPSAVRPATTRPEKLRLLDLAPVREEIETRRKKKEKK